MPGTFHHTLGLLTPSRLMINQQGKHCYYYHMHFTGEERDVEKVTVYEEVTHPRAPDIWQSHQKLRHFENSWVPKIMEFQRLQH